MDNMEGLHCSANEEEPKSEKILNKPNNKNPFRIWTLS